MVEKEVKRRRTSWRTKERESLMIAIGGRQLRLKTTRTIELMFVSAWVW